MMVAKFFKLLIEFMWEAVNLGIEIDGFYIKFWYFPAFIILISIVWNFIGLNISAVNEVSGRAKRYERKGDRRNNDN